MHKVYIENVRCWSGTNIALTGSIKATTDNVSLQKKKTRK